MAPRRPHASTQLTLLLRTANNRVGRAAHAALACVSGFGLLTAGLSEPNDVSSGDLRPYFGPEFEYKLKSDNRRFAMFRSNRTMTYLMIAIVGVGLALAFGFNPFFLLVLAICPLMMFFMMRSMGNMGGHDQASRNNDPHRDDRDRDDRARDERNAKAGR